MEINQKILRKYLPEIAVDQLSKQYTELGYSTTKQAKIEDIEADLIAKKGDEIIVFEIKSGPFTKTKIRHMQQISAYAKKNKNYKFKLVVINPPKEKLIDVYGIEEVLYKIMMENFPDDLDELSTSQELDEIADVDIDRIVIDTKSNINISGSATVSVTLQFGSDSDNRTDDGWRTNDSFPFDFDIRLNKDMKVVKINKLEVDTSSYYE